MAPRIANSAAAKKAAAKKAKRKASQRADNSKCPNDIFVRIQPLIGHIVANEDVATSSQMDTKFSYGVVENTGQLP